MITKQITFSIVLLSSLTSHYAHAMHPKTNPTAPCSVPSNKTSHNYEPIHIFYPAINDYMNNPNKYEYAFKCTLILHLCDLKDHGKTPAQLKKFEERQLTSMKKLKQKIINAMAIKNTQKIRALYYPQLKSIEWTKHHN